MDLLPVLLKIRAAILLAWSDKPRVAGSNPVGEEVPHCSSIGRAGNAKNVSC